MSPESPSLILTVALLKTCSSTYQQLYVKTLAAIIPGALTLASPTRLDRTDFVLKAIFFSKTSTSCNAQTERIV